MDTDCTRCAHNMATAVADALRRISGEAPAGLVEPSLTINPVSIYPAPEAGFFVDLL